MPRRMLGITCCCVLLPLLGCSSSNKAEVDKLKADLEADQKENARLKETISALKATPTMVSHSGETSIVGRVLYKGKPLSAGSVAFIADDGKVFRGPIKNGSYRVYGMLPGKARVVVETDSARHPLNTGGMPGLGGSEESEATDTPAIPRKYASAESTPLIYVVLKGEQEHDLMLED